MSERKFGNLTVEVRWSLLGLYKGLDLEKLKRKNNLGSFQQIRSKANVLVF